MKKVLMICVMLVTMIVTAAAQKTIDFPANVNFRITA